LLPFEDEEIDVNFYPFLVEDEVTVGKFYATFLIQVSVPNCYFLMKLYLKT